MPHIIIEHSSDINNDLILKIQNGTQATLSSVKEGNFDLEQCKVRSHAFEQYLVGSSNQNHSSFLHVTIKILAGRSAEVRKIVAQKVIDFLNQTLSKNIKSQRFDLSVDVVEMDRNTYQKLSHFN